MIERLVNRLARGGLRRCVRRRHPRFAAGEGLAQVLVAHAGHLARRLAVHPLTLEHVADLLLGVGELADLTAEARELQEKIMALPDRILRRAEVFERRFGTASA